MTIKECILRTIHETYGLPAVLYSHHFEGDIPALVHSRFGILHTPSSFARRWREIKSEASLHNLIITEITQQGDRESSWKIELLNTQQVASQGEEIQVHSQS